MVMPRRTGPGGVTIEDVRSAAGRGGLTQSYRPRTLARPQGMPSSASIVSEIIGGPLPTYGEKYGGYQTFGQQVDAIVGGLEPFRQVQNEASRLAAENLATLLSAQRFAPRSPQDYDRLRAEEASLRSAFAEPIDPTLDARIRLAQETEARQQALADTEARLADLYYQPEYSYVRRGREAAREDLRRLRANQPTAPTSFLAQRLAGAQTPEEARQEAYGRSMERMNEFAFRDPTEEQKAIAYSQQARDAQGNLINAYVPTISYADIASQRLGTPLSGQALQETVQPFRTVAAELAAIPRAELAQRLATEQYGMDPALAAGTFGGEFERQQSLREAAAEGYYPDQSTEEYIYMTQGPEAYDQYKANQIQLALDKQAEGFRTVEEEAYDLELEQRTGVNVDQAAGDYSRATARAYLDNPEFVNFIAAGQQTVLGTEALTAEDKRNAIRNVSRSYLEQTGDGVGAQILLNILESSEFLLAF